MSSNIFAQIKPLSKEKKINVDIDKLIAYLSKYHKNNRIFPSAIFREFHLDAKTIYDIMQICIECGIVKPYLEIYCPKCNRYTQNNYEVVTDIPDTINCVHCDEEIENPVEYAVVVYKVVM